MVTELFYRIRVGLIYEVETVFINVSGLFLPELALQQSRSKEIQGASARRMALIVVVMTVHSIAEGVAIGASFAGGTTLATLITVAIAVHNVPEGLAISAVLRPGGASLLACAWWSFFSSLPQKLEIHGTTLLFSILQ